MTGPTTASGLRKLAGCAAGILILVAGAVHLQRTEPPEEAARPGTPEPAAPEHNRALPAHPALRAGREERPAILPLEEPALARFQEKLSLVTTQFMAAVPGVPYPVATARSAQRALSELGYDADRTLRYWLSPQFTADLAQEGQPGRAVDARRTVDNLLSILLGDQGGAEDFAQIIADYSPDVQTLARARRTR